MITVQCDHCGTELETRRGTVQLAEELAGGSYTCADCRGRLPYPDDVPECDIADCEMPATFTVSTKDGDIHRCREDLRRELTGESWNDWRFYRGDE